MHLKRVDETGGFVSSINSSVVNLLDLYGHNLSDPRISRDMHIAAKEVKLPTSTAMTWWLGSHKANNIAKSKNP